MPKVLLKSSKFPGIAKGNKYFPVDIPSILSDEELAELESLIQPLKNDFEIIVDTSDSLDEDTIKLIDEIIGRCKDVESLKAEMTQLPKELRLAFISRIQRREEVSIQVKVAVGTILKQLQELDLEADDVAYRGLSGTLFRGGNEDSS